MTPAGSTSWLLDVTPGANHSLVEEALAYPRVVITLITLTFTVLVSHETAWPPTCTSLTICTTHLQQPNHPCHPAYHFS